MSNFKLSSEVNNKVFLINFSELENRIDCEYYKENLDFSNCIKLKEYVKVKGGKRLPKEHIYSNDETEYLYLRVSNFSNDNDEIDFNNLKFINKDTFEILGRYEVIENDLIFSIAGTVGKLKLISNIPNNKRIILTENAAKIEIINNEILPKYLEIILKTDFLQKQINLNYIQTTIPKIGLDRIENLYIPKIPSKEIQESIIKIYEIYFEKKLQKEQESKELLESIDSYLLNELGITLPEVDNSLEKRIFTIKLNEISGGRFDPDYKIKMNNLENLTWSFPLIELRDVIIGNSQYGANETAQIPKFESDIRYIRITDIDELGLLKENDWRTVSKIEEQYLLNFNDILFARSGSVGKCYIHKNINKESIFAGYLIRFVLNEEKINPDYLFFYCNSSIYKYWVSAIERPAVQSNINSEEYKSLKIPLPSIQKQNDIAKHIQSIRDRAKQLQDEAKLELENAKKEVERLILGE